MTRSETSQPPTADSLVSGAMAPEGVATGPTVPEGVAPACEHDSGCITCGDVAVPVRVTAVNTRDELALCADEHGAACTVDIGLVPDASEGELLLVHAGTALTRIEEDPR